jgi:LPXTG-motif cell wall-anchored protein
LDEHGEEQPITDNTLVKDVYVGNITMTKVDKEDSNVKLAGSVYGIYRALDSYPVYLQALFRQNVGLFTENILDLNGTVTATREWILLSKATTDENGKIEFANALATEEYLIKELEAPDGHKVSANPIKVRMALPAHTDGETVIAIPVLEDSGEGTAAPDNNNSTGGDGLIWYEPRIKLQINLRDENEKVLSGVTLQLKDSNGEFLEEWQTTEAEYDHLILDLQKKLKIGARYTVTTVNVPDGYLTAEISFVINDVEVPNYNPSEGYPEECIQIETIVISRKPSSGNHSNSGNSNKPQQVSDSFVRDILSDLGELGEDVFLWRKGRKGANTGEQTDWRPLAAGALLAGGSIFVWLGRRKKKK